MNTDIEQRKENNDKKNHFTEILMKFLKRENKTINANQAYLQAKYNVVLTEEERIKIFKENLDALISAKCHVGDFSCSVQIENDMLKFLENIVKEYTEKNFTVMHIDKQMADVNNNYIFLCWDKKY